MQPQITLFTAPGTCAIVSAIALEEIGLPFETQMVRFMKGEHKSAAFRHYNPKGRVPALVIDGEVLTETVAIIGYLNARFPQAHLMPQAPDFLSQSRQTADLCFCAATLHSYAPRINFPQRFAEANAARSVHDMACAGVAEYFKLIEDRLADQPWWYGEAWSAMDGYLYWAYWRMKAGGLDVAPYRRFGDHAARMVARPAVARALKREADDLDVLTAEGLTLTSPPFAAGT